MFGTGFRPALFWLARDLGKTVAPDASSLFAQTFHPALDGLAFVGLYDLVGPYLPVLELQARWVAQILSGKATLPSPAAQLAAITASRAMRPALPMHALAVQFARLAGAEPDPRQWPDLERALLFGPLSPASFRLKGPDATSDAPHRTWEAAMAFGRIATPAYEPDERRLRDLVLGTRAAAA